jgi:hypothetical protein
VLAACALAACSRHAVRPPAAATTAPAAPLVFHEEDVAPHGAVRIEILDLHEAPASQPGRVRVVGTIINRGARTTHELHVKLTVYDAKGKVLNAVDAVPSSEVIAGDGGVATFAATIEDRSEIKDYEVEALAR